MAILQMDLENKSLPLSLVPPLPSRVATTPHTSRPSAQAQQGAFVDHARSVGSDKPGAHCPLSGGFGGFLSPPYPLAPL